jgi:hypothetical protein
VNEAWPSESGISATIIELERAALDRWCGGDPSGFLEISAPDVVYFDPFLGHRLDGFSALSEYYESLRGKVSASRWEMVRPLVQVVGPEAAVLTFDFHSWGGDEDAMRWHCTEVYRRLAEGWRIVATHWSFAAKG